MRNIRKYNLQKNATKPSCVLWGAALERITKRVIKNISLQWICCTVLWQITAFTHFQVLFLERRLTINYRNNAFFLQHCIIKAHGYIENAIHKLSTKCINFSLPSLIVIMCVLMGLKNSRCEGTFAATFNWNARGMFTLCGFERCDFFHHLTPNEVITKMASKGKSNTLLIRFEMCNFTFHPNKRNTERGIAKNLMFLRLNRKDCNFFVRTKWRNKPCNLVRKCNFYNKLHN